MDLVGVVDEEAAVHERHRQLQVNVDQQLSDMHVVNKCHVLHGASYPDECWASAVRGLELVWLRTELVADRSPQFRRQRTCWEVPCTANQAAPS